MTMTSTAAQPFRDASPWRFTEPTGQRHYNIRPTVSTRSALQAEFDKLAKSWRNDTQFYSSVTDIVLDRSYQQIIGKGVAVVPMILREIKLRGPDHWYWALGSITGADPAVSAPQGDIRAICDAWVQWGEMRGIV